MMRLLPAIPFMLVLTTNLAWTQEPSTDPTITPLDDSGRLVRMERDIVPIFRTHCLECHGPTEAKNDFRVDDSDSVADYLEPEDAESSSLYVDYLTTDDPDMLMPPNSHGGPLSAGELALIRVWINEGAEWPEGIEISPDSADAIPPVPVAPPPQTLPERIWAAAGFLHPATIHFPIALFVLGGGFVVLGWKWPAIGFQIPLACLLLGTVTAIASTAMGWSFAPQEGYGTNWNILDWDREIDVHRWSGLIVTVLATLFSILALVSLWKDSDKLTNVWKIGLLALAGMVGAVGHQGGELSYGKDFYPRALRILTGADDAPEAAEAPLAEPDKDPAPVE